MEHLDKLTDTMHAIAAMAKDVNKDIYAMSDKDDADEAMYDNLMYASQKLYQAWVALRHLAMNANIDY